MLSYHAALIFSERTPSTLIVPVVSKNFAHRNVVPAIRMLSSELQDQQIIERSFVLPTPVILFKKKHRKQVHQVTRNRMSLDVYKVLR